LQNYFYLLIDGINRKNGIDCISISCTMQREQMLEKQLMSIEHTQREGLYQGKQVNPQTTINCKKVDDFKDQKGLTIAQACKLAEVSIATYYRYNKCR
jgi:DNA invertase Pin-like site-specific DNA recombinase